MFMAWQINIARRLIEIGKSDVSVSCFFAMHGAALRAMYDSLVDMDNDDRSAFMTRVADILIEREAHRV